ncbi:MAG: TrmH family RNA methyltransferase [Carbonactinosporaceae bacterium]
MGQIVSIGGPGDPRLADYVGLTDVALRRRREPQQGLFMAEGERVIRRALDAGYPLRSLLMSRRWLAPMADVIERAEAPAYVGEERLLEEVTGYRVHRGALASMGRKPLPSAEEVLAGTRRVAVLEDINDHTNLGAIFRGAAALAMDAVVLSPRCADPLYRRSVRVSMGGVFAVPYARLTSWPGGLGVLRAAGLRLLALTPGPQAVPLHRLDRADLDRCALMLGAEGSGLSQHALAAADQAVRIPMADGVDSLNVGAAAAVAFYAVSWGFSGPGGTFHPV